MRSTASSSVEVSPVFLFSWPIRSGLTPPALPARAMSSRRVKIVKTIAVSDPSWQDYSPSSTGTWENDHVGFILDVRDLASDFGDRIFVKVMTRLRTSVDGEQVRFRLYFGHSGNDNSNAQAIPGTEITDDSDIGGEIDVTPWCEIDPTWTADGRFELGHDYKMYITGQVRRDGTGDVRLSGTTILVGVLA